MTMPCFKSCIEFDLYTKQNVKISMFFFELVFCPNQEDFFFPTYFFLKIKIHFDNFQEDFFFFACKPSRRSLLFGFFGFFFSDPGSM